MGILVVGLSHRTAPVSLLERTVLTAAAAGKLAEDVAGSDAVDEAVVVSTCNRVEVVADVEKFHAGVAEVSELLARHGGLSLEELTRHLYVHYEDRAVQHVFAVACGLDSMVVGEGQILGQVRAALRTAQQAGTAGRILNELFQQALRVGKRAHADTAIDSAAQSLVGVGLELAAATLGPLSDRCVLVVGAGSMSALAGATLHRAGVRRGRCRGAHGAAGDRAVRRRSRRVLYRRHRGGHPSRARRGRPDATGRSPGVPRPGAAA
jgi:glutamyl-tRNA reductase